MTLTSWNSLDGNVLTQVRTCDVKWAYPQGSKWFIEWLDQRTGGIRQQEVDENSYNQMSSLIDVTALDSFGTPSVGVIKISPDNIAIATESDSLSGTIVKYDIGNQTYSLLIEDSCSELLPIIQAVGSGAYFVSPHSINNGAFISSPALFSINKVKSFQFNNSALIGKAEIDSVGQSLIVGFDGL